ncbi:phosphopentomutase [Caloranaerobacter azorensis DSM 13643]|uniref:Phosphopentomutase n=1 Tax=Caloranaerobacter azorensis DSM 13643 TaxID=1121264 RepID=A0A1M5TCA7_9FIRM|nr:phosphopentomutase [Caloranaerobacter azorensis]SHH48250.1 phosphopentomutase [Caloranaerobacter azorensis DSM 13643]
MIKRVTLIVLDSVGIGALPDAKMYGDEGSHTVDNISKQLGGLQLPNLERLGLGLIEGVNEIRKTDEPIGSFGRSLEKSAGKDTTTGHWEIAGIILEKPFPTYPDGFPSEVISKFEEAIGRKVLGNKPASGTVIIEELGKEHMETGYPIVYTSADSVFQIAAHEEIISVEELYDMCEKARQILTGKHSVGRVIARPFLGKPGEFYRTPNRRDFALKPIQRTILDEIKDNGYDVMAVGKIEDIFAGVGITESVHTKNNMDGVDKTIEFMKTDKNGLIFTNLVDFDMKYGHRNNVEGYAQALKEFDERVPEIIENLKDDEILIITADHGCDPTTPSTDHSREYIPILVYGSKVKSGVNLGTRETFADIGATILDVLGIEKSINGNSFANLIIKR